MAFIILSEDFLENSTDLVCKWLIGYGVNFKRINGEDLYKISSIKEYEFNNDNLIWYRRRLSKKKADYSLYKKNYEIQFVVDKFIANEFNSLHSYIIYNLGINNFINNPIQEFTLGKLEILKIAKQSKLTVPFFEVTTKREILIQLLKRYNSLITKPLNECVFINGYNNEIYKMLTELIDSKNIHNIPSTFYPSLIQENILKKFEIRVFYFYGKCYSMAIFSQQNEKTRIDFRNYDRDFPNRNVPYKIPLYLEKRIQKFMKSLDFNTGSLDFLLTTDNKYVFLEVNPEGQFGMVSYNCNYYLEKKIAGKVKSFLSNQYEK